MSSNALAQVLLDFGRTPGRYALRLREPRELYAQMDTLALWAQGRVPQALQAQAQELKAAAVMFIQRACFAPENTHYQVLGLAQGAVDAELLRSRYRALIRLTHPDMGVEGLPANAAGLVNRAQKVLADPVLRENYDQQLENDAWPRWRTAPAEAHPNALVPSQRKPEAHWLAPPKHLGLGERWRALWARYPVQARLLLTATATGVVVVALLAWAANDTPGGALLVVARSPSTQSLAPAKPAAQRAAAVDPKQATVAKAAERPEDGAELSLSRNPLQLDTPNPRALLADSREESLAKSPAPQPRLRTRDTATDAGPARQNVGSLAQAPAPHATRRDPLPDYVDSVAAPAATRRAGAKAQTLAEARPAPTAPPPAPPPRSTVLGTAPSNTPTPQPTQAAPAPAPTAAAQAAQAANAAAAQTAQWSVDAPGATQYLRDLVATIERPQDAQRAQDLLRKMDVKGNLLTPGLRLGREYPQVRVSALALSPSPRPGALDLNGTVLVSASNPQTAAAITVRYHLAARFVGMPEGTAMSRLELVEVE